MKKITIMLSLLAICIQPLDAQKLKDKLNALKDPKGNSAKNESGGETPAASGPTGNQYVEAKKYQAGNKTNAYDYNRDSKTYTISKIQGEQYKLMWLKNSMKTDADGNINELEIRDTKYVPEPASDPMYYKSTATNSKEGVIFINGCMFHIDGLNTNDGSILGLYSYGTTLKTDEKSVTLDELQTRIKTYITEHRGSFDKIAADTKAANEKKAAEEKAKFSIEGKDVVSIKIILDGSPKEIRYMENVNFSVEAKLKDGNTILTSGYSNFWSDYVITVEGADATRAKVGSLSQNFVGTPSDKVILSVASKYNPKLTASASLNMNYSTKVDAGQPQFTFSTANLDLERNTSLSARVEIKQVKSAVTGEALIAYKVYVGNDSNPKYSFKTKPGEYVNVNTDAKKTSKGDFIPSTASGNDAGDIKVIMDTGITESVNFTASAKGGYVHGKQGSKSAPGRDGKIETVKQKLTW